MKKSEHYKLLEKKFHRIASWVWIVQGILNTYTIVIYIMYYGFNKLIDYWICIDMLTSFALFCFYMYHRQLANKKLNAEE
jgi:hypothetical protein